MEAWITSTSKFYRVIVATIINIIIFVEEHLHLINSPVKKSSYTTVSMMVLADFIDEILLIHIVQIKRC